MYRCCTFYNIARPGWLVETVLQAFLFITAYALNLHCIPDLDERS